MWKNKKKSQLFGLRKYLFQFTSQFLFCVFGFSIVCNATTFNQLIRPDSTPSVSTKLASENVSLSSESSTFTQISDDSIELNEVGIGVTELTNLDYQPQSYRVTVLRLSTVNGQDVYQPSDDLLVEPTSFLLNSKEKKTLNIRLKISNSAQAKYLYRLAVKEVPPLIENRVISANYSYLLAVLLPFDKRRTKTVVE